ncbi:hypothetical protein Rhe02_60850 [Rhizocola hellebori]|uniref:HTH cro/C1-type domain-containing protein n=1 Tax=Rhizocola hellebori TaxID=1392758 RepID=A0A8J3QE73_9ACTN|nr:hypothetical protein Rhe02_60850 [Rhizocola hellebori]
MAEQLGVDRTTVIRWERGDNEPQPWQRPNIAMALKVSVEELDALLACADQASVNISPDAISGVCVSPKALPTTPVGGELMRRQAVHPELLMRYETLTDTYRQMDYQTGSASVYAETIAQLGRMMALADNVPSPLYQRFARALGDSAQLAAWLAIDRQDYGSARHYTAIALSSAQEGDDPTLHAYVLGIMSYIHLHAERGPDAVRLLAAALRLAENPRLGVSPAVRSWLFEAMGEAQALAGNRPAGAAFLAQAERLFDLVAAQDVPNWLGFFNSPEHVTRLKGRCLVKLGDARAAIASLEEAVSALPAHYVRERSGTLIDLATAQLMSRMAGGWATDAEAAAQAALDAWGLAAKTNSARNQRRIRRMLPQFTPYRYLNSTRTLLATVG